MAGKENTPKGNELFSKVTDFFERADKSLDKTRASLESKTEREKLKKEGKLGNLARATYDTVLEDFKADLNEIGIHGEAQKEYLALFDQAWREADMAKKSELMANSGELKALNDFATRLENLPKLQEVMASAQPKARWEIVFNDIATKYLGYKPGDPDSESMMTQIKEWLAKTLGLGFLIKKGTEVAQNNSDQKTPAQAAPAAPQAATPPAAPEITPAKTEADRVLLEKNIKTYKAFLDQKTPPPTYEELIKARADQGDLFKGMTNKDTEAQKAAVDQFIQEKIAPLGTVEEIHPDKIALKAADGGAEKRVFEIKKEINGNYQVSKGKSVPVEFDGSLKNLVEAMQSLEKNPNS